MDYKNIFAAALQFLNRSDLKGSEADALVQIKNIFTRFANGELEVKEKEKNAK